MALHQLSSTTTYFQQRASHATWWHPRSSRAYQNDHILVRGRGFWRVRRARIRAEIITSDHRMVHVVIDPGRLQRRIGTTPGSRLVKPRPDTTGLRDNTDEGARRRSSFMDDVANKYVRSNDHSANLRSLHGAIAHAANSLPRREVDNSKPWFKFRGKELTGLIKRAAQLRAEKHRVRNEVELGNFDGNRYSQLDAEGRETRQQIRRTVREAKCEHERDRLKDGGKTPKEV